MKVFIDIETIPGQAEWIKEHTAKTVAPPANYKKQDTIDAWWANQGEAAKDAAWRKTALNATLGEIIVIAWAIADGPIYSVQREVNENEGVLLTAFYSQLQQHLAAADPMTDDERARMGIDHSPDFIWTGHNVSFDLGFLFKRSVVNNIKPPLHIPYADKPWKGSYCCTVDLWKGNSRDSASMDVLCKAFGIDYSDDIDGSKVWDEIQKGNLADVVAYCEADVDRVRQMYRKMMFR